MAKARDTAFFCKECGYESAKWFGQCPACREWNTASEEPVAKTKTAKGKGAPVHIVSDGKNEPSKLADINTKETDRMSTGIKELDRVLGGGIVAGSLVLVGGDPGIGKSTLLLQMCKNLSHMDKNVLYISGEESLKQIKMRAERIGTFTDKLLLLCETNLDIIEETMKKTMPDVVIIDSIQTMYREDVGSAPGSVSQVRESTAVLMQLAKGLGISIFIVGHVTKEGVVAGPRMLEHMVDTVLYFEGDKNASYRLLRGVKNRFGSTNEIGVFEMQEQGLVEVKNPTLWSPDTPYLYRVQSRIKKGNKSIDGGITRVGIRLAEFRGKDGFWLNGKPFGQLVGANRHQDFAYVGNALWQNDLFRLFVDCYQCVINTFFFALFNQYLFQFFYVIFHFLRYEHNKKSLLLQCKRLTKIE